MKDPSWQIEDSVAPLPGEMVLNKTSSGPLSSTKLDQILHNLGVNSLVVCGLTTAVCVTQTARETADRGFRVIVAEDACTEMSEEMHQAALLTFSYVFGRVRRTEEVVEIIVPPHVPLKLVAKQNKRESGHSTKETHDLVRCGS